MTESKPLYGRGIVIDSFDMPPSVKTRPTTVAVLAADVTLSDDVFVRFAEAYEKGSKLHKVLGGKVFDGNSEIVMAYAGTKGRDEDMGQIRARLESAVLGELILPPHVTYTLRYWNDPERAAA